MKKFAASIFWILDDHDNFQDKSELNDIYELFDILGDWEPSQDTPYTLIQLLSEEFFDQFKFIFEPHTGLYTVVYTHRRE